MEISNLTVSVLYRGKWDLGLIQNLDSDKLLGHEGMLCGFPLSLGLLRFELIQKNGLKDVPVNHQE